MSLDRNSLNEFDERAGAIDAKDTSIPPEVAEAIGWYVYALVDPRDNRVFYIGKGRGERINAHGRDADGNPAAESSKLKQIQAIREAGNDIRLMFLRTNIESSELAYPFEHIAIDALRADDPNLAQATGGRQGSRLTNLAGGHHSAAVGLADLVDVKARYAAEPCPRISEPVIMLKVQNYWRSGMTNDQIRHITEGNWRIGSATRDNAQLAVAVAYGVVRGVFRITPDSWYQKPAEPGRWGFESVPATEYDSLLGTHVRDVFPNQVMYRTFLGGYEPEHL